jgi:nucleoside-triphosphatase THEP1
MSDPSSSPVHLLASVFLTSDDHGLWILTGELGIGKSTWCAAIAEQARAAGFTVRGLFSQAVFERGEKIGIDLVAVETGELRRLGYLKRFGGQGLPVGKWFFNPDIIAWGNEILRKTGLCDLTILDELGALDLDQGGGFQEGLHLLDEGRYHRALVVVRSEWVPVAQERWPQAQVIKLDGTTL